MTVIGLIGLRGKSYPFAQQFQATGGKILAFDLGDASRLRAANDGIVTTSSISGVVMHLPPRKIIVLALENGAETTEVVGRLMELLRPDDIVIDAGATKFAERKKWHKTLTAKGIHFLRGKILGGGLSILPGSRTMPVSNEVVLFCETHFRKRAV